MDLLRFVIASYEPILEMREPPERVQITGQRFLCFRIRLPEFHAWIGQARQPL